METAARAGLTPVLRPAGANGEGRASGALDGMNDSTDGRLRVKNWRNFQHYQHRRPPWIKLHRTLLDDYAFICLPDASQALALRLWLLASESDDGSLPEDPQELCFRLHIDANSLQSKLLPLISAGFISGVFPASAALAPCKRDATLETEGEKRQSRDRGTDSPSAALVPASSWSREACDDWIARFNGTPPGGKIGKALLPLVKAHGWARVREAWKSYLSQAEAEYASPHRFAETFGRWDGSVAVSGGKATTEQKTAENLKAWLASKEAQ